MAGELSQQIIIFIGSDAGINYDRWQLEQQRSTLHVLGVHGHLRWLGVIDSLIHIGLGEWDKPVLRVETLLEALLHQRVFGDLAGGAGLSTVLKSVFEPVSSKFCLLEALNDKLGAVGMKIRAFGCGGCSDQHH